jgi:hypothetical protein
MDRHVVFGRTSIFPMLLPRFANGVTKHDVSIRRY